MSPSAVPQRPRRLGLTVKDYQFKEPLLQSGPHILKNKSERPPSPEDVNAPPLDFSDEDSSLLLDAELSGMGTPPPPQKSRVTRVRVPKIGNVELGAGLSSRTGGRIASHSGLEPSRIGHTDWKTSEGDLGERSLNEGNKQVKRGSNAIEEKDPFDFMGSQKKPRTSYGGLSNIHASPSSPEKKRSTKKIASTVIKNGKDGFRELNIRDIDALRRLTPVLVRLILTTHGICSRQEIVEEGDRGLQRSYQNLRCCIADKQGQAPLSKESQKWERRWTSRQLSEPKIAISKATAS